MLRLVSKRRQWYFRPKARWGSRWQLAATTYQGIPILLPTSQLEFQGPDVHSRSGAGRGVAVVYFGGLTLLRVSTRPRSALLPHLRQNSQAWPIQIWNMGPTWASR